MAMSDDPRGVRRGQPVNREPAAPQQSRGGNPQRDDRYDNYRQPEPPADRQSEKHQPSFSAYRPEAYASAERPSGRQPERSQWEGVRAAPPPPSGSRNVPTSDPFPRAQQQSRDSNRGGSAADPFAAPNGRNFENDWRSSPYNEQEPSPFPSYYPAEESSGPDAQSVHDRFFAPEPERAAAPAPRYQPQVPTFDDHDEADFGQDEPAANGSFGSNYPAQRHHGVHGASTGFDNGPGADEWEKFEQPPAPTSVRPFHPPATVPEEDIDADFFADEDDYDSEDYPPERKGGRKKLMAAVLVGAVVTGGGLAYVYKTSGGAGDGYPSIVSADSRPVKEEPTEPGGRDFPNGNKLIYDRLDGLPKDGAPAPEQPARLASAGSKSAPNTDSSSGTLEERIENALKAQKEEEPTAAAPQAGGGSADAPRAVRTMTFGPDGTPKQAETKTQRITAGSAAPKRPGRGDSGEGLSSGVIVTTQPTSATTREAPPADEPSAEAAEAAPAPRKTRAAAIAQPPAQAQAPAPQINEAAGGTGNFFVQIAARNDQDTAMAAFASLQQKYAGVLGNHAPSVRKVDLGEKGVWFRLLVGPIESKNEADQLCEKLKTAGMKGCFARKD